VKENIVWVWTKREAHRCMYIYIYIYILRQDCIIFKIEEETEEIYISRINSKCVLNAMHYFCVLFFAWSIFFRSDYSVITHSVISCISSSIGYLRDVNRRDSFTFNSFKWVTRLKRKCWLEPSADGSFSFVPLFSNVMPLWSWLSFIPFFLYFTLTIDLLLPSLRPSVRPLRLI